MEGLANAYKSYQTPSFSHPGSHPAPILAQALYLPLRCRRDIPERRSCLWVTLAMKHDPALIAGENPLTSRQHVRSTAYVSRWDRYECNPHLGQPKPRQLLG